MATKPKAQIVTTLVHDPDAQRITRLQAEASRYPYSPVFQETIQLLQKHKTPPVEEKQVSITMDKITAEKLYGLLGSITKQSGFDDVFQALDNADFVLYRRRPRLTFVRDNVIQAAF
jgi:hypothetical protein